MRYLTTFLSALFLFLLFLIKLFIKAVLAILSQNTGTNEGDGQPGERSIYLLDENGSEFIDDGITFGYELHDTFKYRNRP